MYCECVTTISQFDVILQVLLVNQTTKVLQNMTVEFQTLGDLKLVERPAPHTLGPHGFHQIKATIKVSSTEVCSFGKMFERTCCCTGLISRPVLSLATLPMTKRRATPVPTLCCRTFTWISWTTSSRTTSMRRPSDQAGPVRPFSLSFQLSSDHLS